jgi:hypothetical protein
VHLDAGQKAHPAGPFQFLDDDDTDDYTDNDIVNVRLLDDR